MKSFTTNKISLNIDTVGEELKRARKEKKISLEQASAKTSINKKYLKALEDGKSEKLPQGIYGKNFLKEYALFLRLDTDSIIEMYEKDAEEKNEANQKNIFSKEIPKAYYFLSTPRIIKNIIIILILFVCIAYLGYYLKNIFSPPELLIISPLDNITIEDTSISINGQTEPGAEVIVNGEPILIKPDGSFDKELSLKYGLNTVSITAQKKYSRQNKQTKTILVKN